MNLRTRIQELFNGHTPHLQALELLKYIGPGFLVTVGFIDPGNWASNVAAGSLYGYRLLWVVSLSTLMLICLLYTSDAADDLLCVDLGGRRIIKKNKKQRKIYTNIQN